MPRAERRVQRIIQLNELPLVIGLILTWMMLWQEISLMSFVTGIVVAILAARIFYLPPMTLISRFNLWYVGRYLYFFFSQVFIASIQVAWLSVRPGETPRTAIIGVKLHTKSDFILTITGLTNSLIPGSLIAEVDRFSSTLYVHVLDTPTDDAIEAMRSSVYHTEWLLIKAIGSKEDLEALEA